MNAAALHGEPRNALGQLRQHILADSALQQMLVMIEDRDAFVAATFDIATAAGIALASATIAAAIQPNSFVEQTATALQWPGPDWLPAAVVDGADERLVSWTHFAGAPLFESFFEDSLRRAARRPFNRLIRYLTPLDQLAASAPPGLREPNGLIYHLSRCGSTLAAQMLSALPDAQIVSEAPAIDAIVQLAHVRPDLPGALRIDLLRAMISAYGRARSGVFALKLDSWHTLALPDFRAAFPNVPWVFLYRDPVEVLVSHMQVRGLQMVPGTMPRALYGVADGHSMSAEDYCAHVLARVCDGMLKDDGTGGLFVDYATLPDAVASAILPHFGIVPDAAATHAIDLAGHRNAKRRNDLFVDDRATKQDAASPEIRRVAKTHLAERFDALRARSLIRRMLPA